MSNTAVEIVTVGTEVEIKPQSALLIAPGQDRFSDQQVAALRQIGVEEATDSDLQVFFHQCVRTGLDPFLRQIYLIGRNESKKVGNQWVQTKKYTIQTGIDGYSLIAHRAAERAGSAFGYEGEPMWCGPDGKWLPIWVGKTPPVAARVVVLRDGMRFPGVAMYEEYVQQTGPKDAKVPNSMWTKMPSHMLAKCAKASALRSAFPHDLSGIYVDDEMPMVVDTDGNIQETGPGRRRAGGALRAAVAARQLAAGKTPTATAPEGATAEQDTAAAEPEDKPTAAQTSALTRLFVALGLPSMPEKLAAASEALGVEVKDPRTLTGTQMQTVVDALQQRLDTPPVADTPAEPAPAIEEPKLIEKSGRQMRTIFALLRDLEIPDPNQHDYLAQTVGRPDGLEHFTDLTVEEAHRAIMAMQEAVAAQKAAMAEEGDQGDDTGSE